MASTQDVKIRIQFEETMGTIIDSFPHSHLLGWGEPAPLVLSYRCPVCGTPPGGAHGVVMMGRSETIKRLSTELGNR